MASAQKQLSTQFAEEIAEKFDSMDVAFDKLNLRNAQSQGKFVTTTHSVVSEELEPQSVQFPYNYPSLITDSSLIRALTLRDNLEPYESDERCVDFRDVHLGIGVSAIQTLPPRLYLHSRDNTYRPNKPQWAASGTAHITPEASEETALAVGKNVIVDGVVSILKRGSSSLDDPSGFSPPGNNPGGTNPHNEEPDPSNAELGSRDPNGDPGGGDPGDGDLGLAGATYDSGSSRPRRPPSAQDKAKALDYVAKRCRDKVNVYEWNKDARRGASAYVRIAITPILIGLFGTLSVFTESMFVSTWYNLIAEDIRDNLNADMDQQKDFRDDAKIKKNLDARAKPKRQVLKCILPDSKSVKVACQFLLDEDDSDGKEVEKQTSLESNSDSEHDSDGTEAPDTEAEATSDGSRVDLDSYVTDEEYAFDDDDADA
ncbi:hypothetical protein CYMTET_47605 [Cymbomonas tetramitiformis]|uniref:Uncharacterized protein n=1 Tax=Cymbomonas tetramitiformis TaxID=36881 RepID=A0AAE0BTV4_9CHLO|nr:hypothetical protein CYMTET_47605 [Cymbomonas tetramitiformis]